MTRKNTKRLLFIILLFISTIAFVGSSFTIMNKQVTLSLYNKQIWEPQYFSGSCDPLANNLAERQITSHTDDPTWYHCTTDEAKSYVPIVNGIQCEYRMGDSTKTVYICKGFTENQEDLKDTTKCKKETGRFSIGEPLAIWTVNAGDSIFINTDKIIGNEVLYARYPSYGLKIELANGRDLASTTSCELTSLSREYHTIDVKDVKLVVPDVPFNVVTGLRPAISTQAVTLSNVENGNPIYINGPNNIGLWCYYLIKEADDGFTYVDTAGKEKCTSNIQCIPRTTGCNDEAQIVKLEEQPCDKFGGAITDYSPVEGDNTKLCKYTCSSGTLRKSSDCITIQTDCPNDTPLWDARTGKCTSVSEPVKINENNSYLIPIIILFASLIIGIALILNRKKAGVQF